LDSLGWGRRADGNVRNDIAVIRVYNRAMPPAPSIIKTASSDTIAEAARLIRAGRVVAFPTETVYGLGADATDGEAVAAIFAAKNRPDFNPLIIHVASTLEAEKLVQFDDRARAVAAAFWPGPLSLILPRTETCPVNLLAGAGLRTLAVRVPQHPTALALIGAAATPIAAPSANQSGEVSPTSAAHVAASLGKAVDLIVDDGPCKVGLESTVLDLSQPEPMILRPGAISAEDLEPLVGPLAINDSSDIAPRSPGLLLRHYATRIPLRMMASAVAENEALLAFGPASIKGAKLARNLSEKGNLIEAASNLFAMMRALDQTDCTGIAVMPIPDHGIGRAINDRLRRAAHG
jgi:L-threonylcarbamoyladenylate synthase